MEQDKLSSEEVKTRKETCNSYVTWAATGTCYGALT